MVDPALTSPQRPLQDYHLSTLPPTGYYIPNFITEQEEEYLLRKIEETPKPRWRTVGTGRRLQYLGGSLTKNNALIPEPLPAWVTTFPDLITRITDITNAFQSLPVENQDEVEGGLGRQVERANGGGGGENVTEQLNLTDKSRITPRVTEDQRPNQLLVNEYQPGQGISPHEDGPAYHPAVATISLGSSQVLEIFQYLSHTNPSPPLTASSSGTSFPNPSIVNTSIQGRTRSPLATASPITPTAPEIPRPSEESFDQAGKPIATVPMARVFLESRSLFIMTSSLYRTHLHGISADAVDKISAPGDSERSSARTAIANADLLGDAELKAELKAGMIAEKERGTRVSLTFRRVEKVVKGGLLGRAGGTGIFGKK